ALDWHTSARCHSLPSFPAGRPSTEIHTLSLHDALPISDDLRFAVRAGELVAAADFGGVFRAAVRVHRTGGFVHVIPGRIKFCGEIGRAHVCTPVTFRHRMPTSARQEKDSAMTRRHQKTS